MTPDDAELDVLCDDVIELIAQLMERGHRANLGVALMASGLELIRRDEGLAAAFGALLDATRSLRKRMHGVSVQ